MAYCEIALEWLRSGITTFSTGRLGIYHGWSNIMEGEQLRTDAVAAHYDEITIKNENNRTHYCVRTIREYNGLGKLQQKTTWLVTAKTALRSDTSLTALFPSF